MNALRKHVEDQHYTIERPAPVLVTTDLPSAISPARMLQHRLEEATLRSFYAAVPARRTPLSIGGALRTAGAIGAGLSVWGVILALATRHLI